MNEAEVLIMRTAALTAANQAGDGEGSFSGNAAGGNANDIPTFVNDCHKKRGLERRKC